MQKLLRNVLKIFLVFALGVLSIHGISFVLSQESGMVKSETSSISEHILQMQDTLPSSPKKSKESNAIQLKDPPNIKTEVEYIPETNEYKVTKKAGDLVIDRQYVPFKEYQDQEMDRLLNKYWKERAKSSEIGSDGKKSENLLEKYIPGLSKLGGLSDAVGSLLGGDVPSIEVNLTGSAEIIFSIIHNKRKDPSLDERLQKTTNFNFDQNIQIGANAKIGDKINFDLSYNTQAIFNFENKFMLKYEGKEDDILQLLEVGNIQFPVNSSLIQGSQNLFGVHSKMKFGKLTVDALVSEQKSESQNIQIQNGSQSEKFKIKAVDYDENRHYLLTQYFYDHYNDALSMLPVINSNINILKVEVWRTNIGAAVTENRNIVAFSDLGEKKPYFNRPGANITLPFGSELPDENLSNDLFGYISKSNIRNVNEINTYLNQKGFTAGVDYEKLENARKLNPNEFTFNPRIGFITLNTPLTNDQVLAVAFQYQIVGDTNIYQVGEFSDEGIIAPKALVVKLLKSTAINTKIPLWKLMMKNVYFLNSQRLSSDKFRLNVLYERPEGGIPIGFYEEGPQKGIPLIQLLGFDRLDMQQNPVPDGVFDFLDNAEAGGGIIESASGRVYFPYIEPFGKDLRKLLNDDRFADLYCFDSLYMMTKILAEQHPEQNRYFLEGMYTSDMGNEISIGFNVPEGSVKVLAGGIPLVENVDYIVDYMMGRVKILNQGILNSGTPITVTSESNQLFSMSSKRLLGLSLNYEFQKNINLGATIMNLHERVQLTKNDYGYEPISNTIWGVNFSFQEEVPLITRLVNALPGISTKAPSTFTFNTEFAHFIPGISSTGGQKGTTFIDAFEGSRITTDLRLPGAWHLASTPQDYKSSTTMFLETNPGTTIEYGYNRARLAWYRISDVFYYNSRPGGLSKDDISQPYTRRIYEQELYPNKELAAGERLSIQELNLAFYPTEKGPYNYEYDSTRGTYSAGVNADGTLKDPSSRWGGIMRKIDNPDFESYNIDYIEFWMMDPFIGNTNHSGGQLVFNLGDISEDILRDSRMSAESGLPTPGNNVPVDSTVWGRVPKIQSIVNAFDNDPQNRKYQDVGLDGLSSEDEVSFFSNYLDQLKILFGESSIIYQQALKDVSNDDFRFYRSSEWDKEHAGILERYKYFNNQEGNSAIAANNNESYTTSATNYPDIEDVNKDNTLSDYENYYQYIVKLDPNTMEVGRNFITNIHVANITLDNDTKDTCRWYQFKVPIKSPTQVVGNIENFQSIRFIRMFLNGFSERVVLRFASLELVQGTWREYANDLFEPGDYVSGGTSNTGFAVTTVNLEEDGTRSPVPYTLPPGVQRERSYTASSYTQQNEQSLSLKVENLSDGDARAIYKITDFDFRYYKYLKMYTHAEKLKEYDVEKEGDLRLFVRMGSDFIKNYYEYEIPLQYTPWDVSADQGHLIWPDANNIAIDLEKIVEIKENRNRLLRSGHTEYGIDKKYTEEIDGKRLSVLGAPNLGKVEVVMIGIRNPKKQSVNDQDDMRDKSAVVWIDELRLTDFNNSGGMAATALARSNLADIGNVSVFGSYTGAGFGSLEQQIANLEANNSLSLNVAVDLELGKFLPEKTGIKLPVHYDRSYTVDNPKYNPMDGDVKLQNDLNTYTTKREKDSIKSMVQNLVVRDNINFMNVRKERTGKSALKPQFYQIENFSFSYSYSQVFTRNVDIEYNKSAQHKGGLNYSFSTTPKPFKPFKSIKNKNLLFLSDFGLNHKIKLVSFSTEMTRDFTVNKLRNNSTGIVILPPTYYKLFDWNRSYNLHYDPFTSFRIQYTANTNAYIDEPSGKIDSREKKDSVWSSILNLGRAMGFKQNITFNWEIPIHKFPYADWMKANAGYVADYTYTGSSTAMRRMGNVIENGGTFNFDLSMMFTTLYGKIPLLAKANKPKPQTNQNKPQNPPPKPKDQKEDQEQDSIKNSQFKEFLAEAGQVSLRLLSSVKNASFRYSKAQGSIVPGFKPEVKIIGLAPNDLWTPGWKFILGATDDRIMQQLIDLDALSHNGILSRDSLMNEAFRMRYSKTLSGSASLEPIRFLKIDLNFNQSYSESYTANYKFNIDKDEFVGPITPMRGGAFNSSVWLVATAFKGASKDGSSNVFDQFMENRLVLAERLAGDNSGRTSPTDLVYDSVTGLSFPKGYSASSQQVLLPALLAAYMGKDASSINYSPFIKIPMPNWDIKYNGLSKMEFFKQWFSNLALSNSYKASYSIANYTTNPYIGGVEGYDYGNESSVYPLNGDFIPIEIIDQITLQEQFSPLIRIDYSLKNSLVGNIEYRMSRTIGLSLSNTQLTETSSKGFVLGVGYRFKEVPINIQSGEGTFNMKSDIVTKLDLSWMRNLTILHMINQAYHQTTAGTDVFSFTLSGEYAVSEKLMLRLFFKMNINTPAISSSIPNSNTEGGISIRFSF